MDCKRYLWIDRLRGVAILAMVVYHGAYDLIDLYGINKGIVYELFYSNLISNILHPIFAGLFIYLCGISSHLSKNNYKRGMQFLILGILLSIITLVSEIFISGSLILFGILHLLGVCVLAYSFWGKLFNRQNLKTVAVLLIILAILTKNLAWGKIGIGEQVFISIPTFNNGGITGLILFIIGLPVRGYFSSDYFPLIPWALVYIAGVIGGNYLKEATISEKKGGLLVYAGRHTLWIYIFHQPILILVLSIVMGRLPS